VQAMKVCSNCGSEFEDGQVCGCGRGPEAPVFFASGASNYKSAGTSVADAGIHISPGFFESMKNRMGVGTPEQNSRDTYEREMNIVPECISAEENEIPVKQYTVAVLRNLLKLERAEGRLQVTNKRVVFRATGRSIRGRTTLQNEFAINEIGGIEARRNYKFSFLYLVFAFLISLLSYGVIAVIFSQSISLPAGLIPFTEVADGGILSPPHVQKAYENVRIAEFQTAGAEKDVQEAKEKVKTAKEAEETAAKEVRDGVRRTRRVLTGHSYWGEPIYESRTYIDTTQATLELSKAKLDLAVIERGKAENAEAEAVKKLDAAKQHESEMIKKRNSTESIWRFVMTVFGFLLGVGGLVPFFVLYQRFGLKLFIIGFSTFGFVLSLTASGVAIFYLFIFISLIIDIICTIIYCFRPNLVLSIKNKSGMGEAVNVRRDKSCWPFTWFMTVFEEGLGFYEVIPTEESNNAIREVGAMIGDIQKMGDLGLGKWQVK
jgi:hypothetical protein